MMNVAKIPMYHFYCRISHLKSPFRRQLGICNPFGICGAQDRGRMFINNKDEVFKDMIIGMMIICFEYFMMIMLMMMDDVG
jgi:hypothetical protein